ncbi:L-malate glycosyltransferase [Methylomarinovum caldicuralii]|uniref:L-malate glycosyltransferase n=1 Tax=Methylomarinovum caldicuralii TaxID=438856 RepID=A0AAU9C1D6_9GAMM|nr:glycosyltransferase family 4 protein [Methylomarinovum caldicuralii]BCX82142.1 L-malate glycosyltransferase [Methylomarinovum caldicuralii]
MKRIKVCYLSESSGDWGGASRVLFTNLRHLDRQHFEPLVLLPGEGPIMPELQRWGVAYRFWSGFTEPGNPLAYLKSLLSFYRFLKRERIAIVHANHTFWRPAEILAARLARVPVVTHYHVVMKQPGPFVGLSSLIIANSAYTASVSGPPQVPKKVIHNPTDLQRFDRGRSIRRELGIGDGETVIAFLGQMKQIKGVDLFLDMSRRLSGRRPNLKFLLAGRCQSGSGAYSEEALQAEIGGHPDIRYLGRLDDPENLYHSADIIVMPSRWDEPFGLIAIEAGACRKPIVATRVGGIPEIIEDGVTGFLVERDDLEALVSRVQQLIDDPGLRQRMGEAGMRKVEREFTDKPVRELESAYRELLQA